MKGTKSAPNNHAIQQFETCVALPMKDGLHYFMHLLRNITFN